MLEVEAVLASDVFICKSVSELNVTIVQPRDTNFMGRIVFIGLNFIVLRFAQVKNFSFGLSYILRRNE